MLPTLFASPLLPVVANGSATAPAIIVHARKKALRVVVRALAGFVNVYSDPNAAQMDGNAGTYRFPANASEIFVLAPGQALYASGTVVFPTSVSVSELAPDLFKPRPGMMIGMRVLQTTIPAAQTVPVAVAEATDFPIRVEVRAFGAGAILNTEFNELSTGPFGFIVPVNFSDVFVLAPGQKLYALNSSRVGAPVTLSITRSDGTLITDTLLMV